MGHTVYIGLGGNIEPRRATLEAALDRLRSHPDIAVRAVSRFHETEPLGPAQPAYLNAAAELWTDLAPRELLDVLHDVERSLGRDRSREQRWGPRTCDLDIELIDEMVIADADLTVPHPDMHKRRFVLAPLAEIAPDARHPTLGRSVCELLAALDEDRP